MSKKEGHLKIILGKLSLEIFYGGKTDQKLRICRFEDKKSGGFYQTITGDATNKNRDIPASTQLEI